MDSRALGYMTCTNAPIDHSANRRVKYRQTEVTKKLVAICTEVAICTNTRHQKTSNWLMMPSTSGMTQCKYTCNGVNSAPLRYHSDAFLFVYAAVRRRHTDMEFKTFKIIKYCLMFSETYLMLKTSEGVLSGR